ncbi:MAG: hypothetical protein WCP57_06340 [Bacteroidota bacterium]
MKTLDLLKNVKTITNTKAIKGGQDSTILVSFTSIDINSDLTLIEDTKDITKEINVKGN